MPGLNHRKERYIFCILTIFLYLGHFQFGMASPSDSTNNKSFIRTRTVYKYNWNFKDSTKIYYEEIDSAGGILKREGQISFELPPESAYGFEWAIANCWDGDTLFVDFSREFELGARTFECAEFVMKFGTDRKPLEILQYACFIKDGKTIGSNLYMNKAVFSYYNNGLKVVMDVIEDDGHISERFIWVSDREGRGLMDQWEIPTEGLYYRIYYDRYYR